MGPCLRIAFAGTWLKRSESISAIVARAVEKTAVPLDMLGEPQRVLARKALGQLGVGGPGFPLSRE
jgi:hypothetical protein